MYSDVRLKDLLEEMLRKSYSVARLADRIHVSERNLRNWLKLSENELHHIHSDSIASILKAARSLGVEPEQFKTRLVLWDPGKSYKENLMAELGDEPQIEVPFYPQQYEFLGHRIGSVFGASASILTSRSNRVRFLARTGASVIVYKTVRPTEYKPHVPPNLLYCAKETRQLDPDESPIQPVVVGDSSDEYSPKNGAMNRFGMPSPPPEIWQADFRAASESLPSGSLLILSVVGASSQDESEGSLTKGFVKVVELAITAKASLVELNLSCPNCTGKEGSLYHNLPLVVSICKELRKFPVKKILKIGFMKGRELRDFVIGTAGYVDAYSAINSISVEGLRDGQNDLEPAFGKPKLRAGLSGKPILRCGLRTVSELHRIRETEGLKNIRILGMGGVSSHLDVESYLQTGADVVLATTAFLTDPYFANGVRRFLDKQYAGSKFTAEQEIEIARMNWSRAVEKLIKERGANADEKRRINEAGLSVFIEWQNKHDAESSSANRRAELTGIPDEGEFSTLIRKRIGQIWQ